MLLKKLISLGIGNRMLQALKRVYSGIKRVLSLGGETSDPFQTYTGIRQGAPSSVFLFILFIDDFITYLKANCGKPNNCKTDLSFNGGVIEYK